MLDGLGRSPVARVACVQVNDGRACLGRAGRGLGDSEGDTGRRGDMDGV